MTFLSQIQTVMLVLMFTLVASTVGIFAAYQYFFKKKKIAASEEHINYDKFERRNAKDYARFKNIIEGHSSDGLGMIDMGNGIFVGGIDIAGFDYYSASTDVKMSTIQNMIAFMNIIDKPIQIRQTVEANDISYHKQKELEIAKDIERRQIELNNDLQMAIEVAENNTDNDEVYEQTIKRIKKIQNSLVSLSWMSSESKEIRFWMDKVSDANVNAKKVNQLLFSYVFNPDKEFDELSEEEIIVKAQSEMEASAERYGDAITAMGCSWKPISADGLANLIRQHMHPISAYDVRMDEILNDTYKSLYITSDSYEEIARQKMGELAYEEEMKLITEKNRKMREENEKRLEHERRILQKEAAGIN